MTTSFQWRRYVEKAGKKKVEWWNGRRRRERESERERDVERKGTLRGRGGEKCNLGKRERGDGKGRKDERTGESAEMKTKKRATTDPQRRHDKLDTSFHQTKLFICLSISSSSLNVDILQFACPGSPAMCFLSLFDKGDHGGWSSVDPGARLPLMEECCCLLLRTASQLETHLWAFLSSLPARSKQLPPSERIYISP